MNFRIKYYLRLLLEKMGYTVVRHGAANTLDRHLAQVLKELKINCVLDVGAHTGEFGVELRRIGYSGRIVSFEPVSEAFRQLESRAASDSNWKVYPVALSEKEGVLDINIYAGSTFSSFLKPSKFGHENFNQKLELSRIEQVQVKTLDQMLEACIQDISKPRIFLKMDTQGFDLAVMRGVTRSVDQILGIQTELASKPIYQEMGTSLTVGVDYFQKIGMEITGFFPVVHDKLNPLSVIEFDCVMCRPQNLVQSIKFKRFLLRSRRESLTKLGRAALRQ